MKTSTDTKLTRDYFQTAKFGSLRMEEPQDSSRGSHKKVSWICDCGRKTEVAVCTVVSGNTSSCRKCNMLTAEDMMEKKFGKLRMTNPADLMPGSRTKVSWTCDCGRVSLIQPLSVTSGHSTSCGKCFIPIDLSSQKYGSLTLAKGQNPEKLRKLRWECDCGKSTIRPLNMVLSGHTRSCGKCRILPIQYWVDTKFGHLKMTVPQQISKGSNQEMSWTCDCGGNLLSQVYPVTAGKTTRCGSCQSRAHDWYSENRSKLRSLKTPFEKEDFPKGGPSPVEDVSRYMKPFKCICMACGGEYFPMWSNIVKGSSLTCGCAANSVSRGQKDLFDFIRSLGLEAELEHKVSGLRFDIFVPSHGLLLEYHGLRWHQDSRSRDLKKAKAAESAGFQLLVIFEDEWTKTRHKVENLLRNHLVATKPRSLRPQHCRIGTISGAEANALYDKHHYIGRCVAKEHYGVVFEDRVIAAASFSIPTRQSRHPWELLRMVGDPEFRVHGGWTKLLQAFVTDHRPSSVVSFSDNRLFGGGVYERIGFKRDGDITPDYFWVRGGVRHHKSGLRKKGAEKESGLTERELREAEGYKRVWDLGKTRWVWTP